MDLLTRRLTLLGRYFPTSVLLKYGFRKPRTIDSMIDGDCGLAHPDAAHLEYEVWRYFLPAASTV